jgi:hypothetical protein
MAFTAVPAASAGVLAKVYELENHFWKACVKYKNQEVV